MTGVFFEGITKDELLNDVRQTIGDEVLVLMTTDEAAALLGCSHWTVTQYKNSGKLTDYSSSNNHQKFSAKQVLRLRRKKNG